MKTIKLEVMLKVNGKLVTSADAEFPAPSDASRLSSMVESHLDWLVDGLRESADAPTIIDVAQSTV